MWEGLGLTATSGPMIRLFARAAIVPMTIGIEQPASVPETLGCERAIAFEQIFSALSL